MPDKKPLTLKEAVRAITSTPRMSHEPKQQQPADDGPQPAKVFEDHKTGQWRVEGLDDDGHSEVEIFTGYDARRQALRYAMRTYGHFREVQLEQEGETPRVR
jgi:homospermidine synthase